MTSDGSHSSGEGNSAGGWRAALLFAVLFAIVAAYYVVHKPFGATIALTLGLDGLRVLLAGMVISAAGAVGLRLIGPLSWAGASQAVVYAAVGLGLAGIFWLILGATLGINAWMGWIVLAAVLALLRRSVLAWLRMLKVGVLELKPNGAFEAALATVVTALLAADLLEALGPPLHFDALVYHLALPRSFLDAGRIVFDPSNPFWGSPLLVEVNYAWAMALGGDSTAVVLGLIVGILTLMGIHGLANRWSDRAGWVAVTSLMVGETLWSSMAWGYVDWYAALFGLAVVICLEGWLQERRAMLAALAGGMAGFAMGTKYTAGVVIAAGLAVVWVCGQKPERVRATLGFVGAAGLAFAAWPLKNLIATGAPLYPYLGASPWVSAAQQAFFSSVSSTGFEPVGPLVPLFATVFGVEGAPGYASSIGPLLLGLSLAVFAGPVRRRGLSGLLVTFVVAGWLVWGGANFASELLGQSRLFMAIFPAWAALAGLGYANLQAVRLGSVRLGRLTQAVVIIVMGLGLVPALRWFASANPLSPALGLETRAQTLDRRTGTYAAAMVAVRQLDGPGSVVMLWEPRGYYCQPECVSDPWIDRWYALRRAGLNNAAILEHWKAGGAAYVLLNRPGMAFVQDQDPRYSSEDWSALDRLLGMMSPVERFGDSYVLYEIP